ncbi:M48 family metalloprotease [Streptomyces sp. NPDC020951]|uniref:M48 family metalloprotease n=1 Tax=Streptomyces sp. NPDC020951 TaxID=3365104 RepID=UPI0037A038BC
MTVSEGRATADLRAATETATETATGAEPGRRPGRALSPTGARYVLLIVTLVLAGAFAGQVVHGLVLGPSWAEAALQCWEEGPRLFPDSGQSQAEHWSRCTGPLQRRQALVSLAGAAAVLLLGLAVMWTLPRRLMRGAGPLKTAPPDWQERVGRIAAEMGVRRPPCVMWGGGQVREAFVLGRGSRCRIILPRGMRLLGDEEAEAILRHEIGHVAAGDVTLVWLTRGVWWALPPVLLTAPLVAAVQGWRSRDTSAWRMLAQPFWAEYGVRAAVLAVTATLVAQMIMRSREHEADLAAVRGQSVAPWETLLGGPRPAPRTWLDAARANHPTHRRRMTVLRAPHLQLAPTVLDTLVVGLLAAVLLDSVHGLATLLLTGTSWSAAPVSALAAGLLLAVGWGLPVWRGALAQRNGTAPPSRWLPLALGVSTAAGLLVRLQGAGTTAQGPMLGWTLLLALPAAVVGAAALSTAFAGLWSRRRGAGDSTIRDRLTVIAVSTLLFSGALWLAMDFSVFLRLFSADPVLGAALLTGPYSPSSGYKAVASAAIAVPAVWCAVRGSHRPEHRPRLHLHRWLPALTAVGAAGAAVTARLAYRSSATAGDWTGTWRLDVLTALCAGAVCAVMLVVLRGSGGLGHVLYAAPLTTVLTVTVLWATRFGSWKHPFEAWGSVLVTSSLAGLAVVLLALAVPAGFLPTWDSGRGAVQIAVPALAVIVAAAAVLALQHSGDTLLLR